MTESEQRKPTFISPWQNNTGRLSCADSRICEPKWPPVGRAATTVSGASSQRRGAFSEEDGNREAGTVDCPALRLLGTPSLPTRLLGASPSARPRFFATHDRIKNFGVWGVHAKQATPTTCKIHAKSCHAKSSKMPTCKIVPCQAKPCETSYSPQPSVHRWSGRMRRGQQKKGPVKKEWPVGQDNDNRSRRPRTAAPGLARGRMEPSC